VYCPDCVPQMAEFPEPRPPARVVVLAVNSLEELAERIAELTGFDVQGGHA